MFFFADRLLGDERQLGVSLATALLAALIAVAVRTNRTRNTEQVDFAPPRTSSWWFGGR